MMPRQGTSLWKALLIEGRLPWRYKQKTDALLNTAYKGVTAAYLSLKGYSAVRLPQDKNSNLRYDIYRKDSKILKVVKSRWDNPEAKLFRKNMRSKTERDRFAASVRGAAMIPLLGKNICRIIRLDRDGSYQSPFVEGPVLKDLKMQAKISFPAGHRSDIAGAIARLKDKLLQFEAEHSSVKGDWALSNLIYSAADKDIINVDLEGFYHSDNEGKEDIRRIIEELEVLKRRLLAE